MKKWLWRSLGIIFVALAYIGIITPGVPTTIFAILAAWAFSKSSPKLNKWLHNHKIFGKYLNNWENKRIFPSKGRIAMCLVMLLSTISIYFIHNDCGLPLKEPAIFSQRFKMPDLVQQSESL